MQEYERRKQAVQEELKRQYKDILEENMRNADLRSQMVREQQTVDI